VHIRHHNEPGLKAELAERRVAGAVEDDDAGIETVWVEIVVVDEAPYLAASSVLQAEQESATLRLTTSTLRKFGDPHLPERAPARQPVLRCRECPYSRANGEGHRELLDRG
jgi:hypothetical protein